MTPEQSLLITAWQKAANELPAAKAVIEAEQELRKQVVAAFFPTPKEGANTLKIFGDWALKFTYKIDRKIDVAALPAVIFKLRDMGINTDTVVVDVPTLALKEYKALHEIHPDAGLILDGALIIKPGSPTLVLVPPKSA